MHFALKTYSITDEERLKQIAEEEAASLRLIRQLQEEEVKAMREQLKREELDRQYARMISSTLNKPLPTEPVIDTSDCVVSYKLHLSGLLIWVFPEGDDFIYFIFNYLLNRLIVLVIVYSLLVNHSFMKTLE